MRSQYWASATGMQDLVRGVGALLRGKRLVRSGVPAECAGNGNRGACRPTGRGHRRWCPDARRRRRSAGARTNGGPGSALGNPGGGRLVRRSRGGAPSVSAATGARAVVASSPVDRRPAACSDELGSGRAPLAVARAAASAWAYVAVWRWLAGGDRARSLRYGRWRSAQLPSFTYPDGWEVTHALHVKKTQRQACRRGWARRPIRDVARGSRWPPRRGSAPIALPCRRLRLPSDSEESCHGAFGSPLEPVGMLQDSLIRLRPMRETRPARGGWPGGLH